MECRSGQILRHQLSADRLRQLVAWLALVRHTKKRGSCHPPAGSASKTSQTTLWLRFFCAPKVQIGSASTACCLACSCATYKKAWILSSTCRIRFKDISNNSLAEIFLCAKSSAADLTVKSVKSIWYIFCLNLPSPLKGREQTVKSL